VTTNHPEYPWIKASTIENWHSFPHEELAKYVGQYIAFNWECTHILESAVDEEELFKKLDAAGIDSSRVIINYVESSDCVIP